MAGEVRYAGQIDVTVAERSCSSREKNLSALCLPLGRLPMMQLRPALKIGVRFYLGLPERVV